MTDVIDGLSMEVEQGCRGAAVNQKVLSACLKSPIMAQHDQTRFNGQGLAQKQTRAEHTKNKSTAKQARRTKRGCFFVPLNVKGMRH